MANTVTVVENEPSHCYMENEKRLGKNQRLSKVYSPPFCREGGGGGNPIGEHYTVVSLA